VDRHKALDPFAISIMVVLCALWGSNQGILKFTAREVHPIYQVGLRCLIASVLTMIWAYTRGERLHRPDGTLWAGLLAGLLFAAEFVIVAVGLGYTTASHMSVFLYTAPIFTALGLHWLVAEERMGGVQWLGVLLTFAGVFAIFATEFVSGKPVNPVQLAGDALAILGGLLWAATTVVIKASSLKDASPAKVTFYQLAMAAVVLLAISPFLESGVSLSLSGWAWASILWQAVIIAFASYLLWFWLMKTYSASKLSIASFLTPVFGVAFGVLVLDEPLTFNFVGGAVLILIGIAIVNGALNRPVTRA
jgi:drug/metabolite transporter (DMT)-like permease